MKNKILCALLAAFMLFSLAACTRNNDTVGLKIGFITDGSAIDANGINKGIWSTLQSMKTPLGIESAYAVPADTQSDTLKNEIKKLVDKGFNMIVLPSYVFAEALQDAQILYKDVKFIALDFAPQTLGESAVSISFNAHEAGFMAGFAAAIKLQSARMGAILGMEIPAYQKYSWGFQQGVLYANQNFGTSITMDEKDFVYLGTVTNDSLGQQYAAQLYDSGVDCIFIAAGAAGSGALIEAKLRRANGQDIWAVGSEYSQYTEGVYDGNNSVIITSAIKRWNDAVIDMVDAALKGEFPGKQTVVYSAANEGVGMPVGEYNLTVKMREECTKLAEKLKKGDIKVSDKWSEEYIK